MKNTLLVTSLLAVVISTGCKPSTKEATARQLDKAQAATKEAVQEMRDYTFEQKAEFVSAMQAQLADLNRNLDEVSARIEKSSDAVKANAKPKLAALRVQAAQLDKKLGEIANSTPSTWDNIKADAQKGYSALKDGVKESRQWVSDKIAP